MRWLLRGRGLRELGVVGMNRRNAECILDQNPRALFPIVDDKRRFAALCARIGVPTPPIHGVIESHAQLRQVPSILRELPELVIKPNRGAAGRGILLLPQPEMSPEDIHEHLCDILAGGCSLGGHPDCALLQHRVPKHPDFAEISPLGIPDVRILLYRGVPAMAMLRLPTRDSRGRANLHQGGLGVGIDLETGTTIHAIQRDRTVLRHPDTGTILTDRILPEWHRILEVASRVARAVGLGYLGVDVVFDPEQGPLVLEANARPGLAIQLANRAALGPRVAAIDRQLEARVELTRITLS